MHLHSILVSLSLYFIAVNAQSANYTTLATGSFNSTVNATGIASYRFRNATRAYRLSNVTDPGVCSKYRAYPGPWRTLSLIQTSSWLTFYITMNGSAAVTTPLSFPISNSTMSRFPTTVALYTNHTSVTNTSWRAYRSSAGLYPLSTPDTSSLSTNRSSTIQSHSTTGSTTANASFLSTPITQGNVVSLSTTNDIGFTLVITATIPISTIEKVVLTTTDSLGSTITTTSSVPVPTGEPFAAVAVQTITLYKGVLFMINGGNVTNSASLLRLQDLMTESLGVLTVMGIILSGFTTSEVLTLGPATQNTIRNAVYEIPDVIEAMSTALAIVKEYTSLSVAETVLLVNRTLGVASVVQGYEALDALATLAESTLKH